MQAVLDFAIGPLPVSRTVALALGQLRLLLPEVAEGRLSIGRLVREVGVDALPETLQRASAEPLDGVGLLTKCQQRDERFLGVGQDLVWIQTREPGHEIFEIGLHGSAFSGHGGDRPCGDKVGGMLRAGFEPATCALSGLRVISPLLYR